MLDFTNKEMKLVYEVGNRGALPMNIEHASQIEQAERLAVMEERQRLARDLHDSVAQALYSITLYADAAHMAFSAGKQQVGLNHLQELRNLARETVQEMRLLIFELHPLELEKRGWVVVLRARLSAVEERSGLQIHYVVDGEKRLPLSVEGELYKIALEALNNVIKHANAQHLEIQIRFDDLAIRLEIKDDGVGFNPEQARQSGGMGLRGIEERVALLGGRLEIDSFPGMGTRLSVSIPSCVTGSF